MRRRRRRALFTRELAKRSVCECRLEEEDEEEKEKKKKEEEAKAVFTRDSITREHRPNAHLAQSGRARVN